MKVLIIAHGHPQLRAGGAERVAYSHFEGLTQVPSVDATLVSTCAPAEIGHDGSFGLFRGRRNEVLWAAPAIDAFRFESSNSSQLRWQCQELLETWKPDVVHFHHYTTLGVEVFSLFKEVRPDLPIVLTLHEYLLICNNHGQMVKNGSGRLCKQSSYSECAACYPTRSAGKFFLRHRYLLRSLDSVDLFISPSEFLKSRYVDWGLEEERVRVVENPPPLHLARAASTERATAREDNEVRFGYFGQINPFKGIQTLIDAMRLLSDHDKKSLSVIVYGANLEHQNPEWRDTIKAALDAEPRILLFGSYDNEDVADLMRSVDWLIVPSNWWENSPVVIQEARALSVPILCSDIGGMKEKVRPGIDGAHFKAGSAVDLAHQMRRIVQGRLVVRPPARDVEAERSRLIAEHVQAYRELFARARESA